MGHPHHPPPICPQCSLQQVVFSRRRAPCPALPAHLQLPPLGVCGPGKDVECRSRNGVLQQGRAGQAAAHGRAAQALGMQQEQGAASSNSRWPMGRESKRSQAPPHPSMPQPPPPSPPNPKHPSSPPSPHPSGRTCRSSASSVQASSTTPGAAKQAKLSMWPLVSSSPTSPLGSQMTFCSPGQAGEARWPGREAGGHTGSGMHACG